MWRSDGEALANGTKYRMWHNSSAISFEMLFSLLAENQSFVCWYTELLAQTNFNSFFWEHPALRSCDMSQLAEFVLIEAHSLTGLRADPNAFADQLAASDDQVVVFKNLGGDAELVAPCPPDDAQSCAHLAPFVRTAPGKLVSRFWNTVGKTVLGSVNDRPLWLSTSGLGVPWLHVRLDSIPKYYQYVPYK